METQINYHRLTMPLEFRVTCAVYRLNEQEVLQIFINHATVYDSLADPYSEGYSEASKTIGLYVAEKGEPLMAAMPSSIAWPMPQIASDGSMSWPKKY